jgi:hypothetical protein
MSGAFKSDSKFFQTVGNTPVCGALKGPAIGGNLGGVSIVVDPLKGPAIGENLGGGSIGMRPLGGPVMKGGR